MVRAQEGDVVDITDSGVGTHTITLTEYTPYDGRFDNFLMNMMVLYAKSTDMGGIDRSSSFFDTAFKRKAFEELRRRNFVKKLYYIDF
jgi:hypothetical protein